MSLYAQMTAHCAQTNPLPVYASNDIVSEIPLSTRTVLLPPAKVYVTSVVRQIQPLISFCVSNNIPLVIVQWHCKICNKIAVTLWAYMLTVTKAQYLSRLDCSVFFLYMITRCYNLYAKWDIRLEIIYTQHTCVHTYSHDTMLNCMLHTDRKQITCYVTPYYH